jgi:hypothetical protein
VQLYKSGFAGWNVAHFHSKYRAELSGARSYSWLKSVLQGAGVVKACKVRGKHRKTLGQILLGPCRQLGVLFAPALQRQAQ